MSDAAVSAYLLHSKPFQDQKLLVDLLVDGVGRVRAVVRRPAKKQGRSQYPLFCPLWLVLSGQGELKTVRRLEEQQGQLQLTGRWLFSAIYLNELICRLFPATVPAETLFLQYRQSLQLLNEMATRDTDEPTQKVLLEAILRRFELAVLAELGLPLDLTHCIDGEPISPSGFYRWLPEQGLLRSGQGFAGADLLAIAAGDWQTESLRSAKLLCRQLLQPLLGNAPLLSRQLFQGQLS